MSDALVELRDTYELESLSYLDSENSDERIDFWAETHEDDPEKLTQIREQNAKAIKDMFQRANAAPSNLRFGDGGSNSAIQENFDPMGDASGKITAKESLMLEKYVINYETEEFDGEYYLRSSTGVTSTLPDLSKTTHWYIQCINNNIKCF